MTFDRRAALGLLAAAPVMTAASPLPAPAPAKPPAGPWTDRGDVRVGADPAA
jgi:hypothetical protein